MFKFDFWIDQAVIAAPCEGNSKELSLSLANRSAALFSLKAYNLALDDIRLALEVGYPKELRFKLLERKVLYLNFIFSNSFVHSLNCIQ